MVPQCEGGNGAADQGEPGVATGDRRSQSANRGAAANHESHRAAGGGTGARTGARCGYSTRWDDGLYPGNSRKGRGADDCFGTAGEARIYWFRHGVVLEPAGDDSYG